MKHIMILVLLLTTATNVLGEHSRNVATYKKHMGSEEHRSSDFDHNLHHMLFLTGIGDTYHFLNTKKANSGDKVFYCQPEETKLTGQEYTTLFEKFIHARDDTDFNAMTLPEAMLLALQQKFPCP